jgi:hypothetical protein
LALNAVAERDAAIAERDRLIELNDRLRRLLRKAQGFEAKRDRELFRCRRTVLRPPYSTEGTR